MRASLHLTWALLLALALSPLQPARAGNTADEADVAFQLGNEAFAKRQYEQALAHYFVSHRLVPNRNVLFNIARCFEALGRLDEAYRYYNDLLGLDLPAEDRKEAKAALSKLSPRVALLSVTTEPDGADLYVDREDLGSRGRTPQTVAVAPGAHKVLVRLEGYKPAEVSVTALKGREAKQRLQLAAIVGTVSLEGSPAGAVVRERPDGPELGRLPVTLTFKPGQVLLHVSADGYTPSQTLVKVEPDAEARAKVELAPLPRPTGKVVITANRENALVKVDGKESGFTPTVVVLTAGEHEVEITARDLRPFSQKVLVRADQEARIVADLRYAPPPVRAASKSLVQVDDSPASISVITREEILAFGWQTLAEAMATQRGVFVSNDRIYSYLGVRGFSPPGDLNTRILILYDGHPMNDAWAGQGFAARDLDVDLSEIDRIEVVRGPGSALYGTGAFFAVINLVPRTSVDGNRNVEGVLGAGGLTGGKARASGGLQREAGGFHVSAAGFLAAGAELTDMGERGTVRGLDGERALGATVQARVGDVSLLGKINQRRKQVPTAPAGTLLGAPGTTYVDARGFAELRFDHSWERVSLAARAWYDASRFDGHYAYDTGDGSGESVLEQDLGGADWFGAELRGRFRLFGENVLTVGLEGQGQLVFDSSTSLGPETNRYTRVLLSGYLLDEWRIHRRFSISAGVRVDKYLDLEAIPVTPRAGIVLRPYDGGLTKLGVGRAFRAPNIYELYYTDGNLSQRPALRLNPETITTFELEHSHDLTEELRITVGGYHNLIDNLVELTQDQLEQPECGPDRASQQCYVYTNSPELQQATGAELQVRWQPGRHTLIDATYSFVWIWGTTSSALVNAPQHLVNLRAMVPLFDNALRVSMHGLYQSPRGNDLQTRLGEAFLLSAGLSGEFGRLRWFAGVQNLLDQRYRLPVATEVGFVAIPQDGRTFWVEIAAGI